MFPGAKNNLPHPPSHRSHSDPLCFSHLLCTWPIQSRGHERVPPGKGVNTSQSNSLGANICSWALGSPISAQKGFTTFLGGKTQWLSRLLLHSLRPACSLTSVPAPRWGWQTGDMPQRLGGSECLWSPWERTEGKGHKKALTLLSLDAPWCDNMHLAPSQSPLPLWPTKSQDAHSCLGRLTPLQAEGKIAHTARLSHTPKPPPQAVLPTQPTAVWGMFSLGTWLMSARDHLKW